MDASCSPGRRRAGGRGARRLARRAARARARLRAPLSACWPRSGRTRASALIDRDLRFRCSRARRSAPGWTATRCSAARSPASPRGPHRGALCAVEAALAGEQRLARAGRACAPARCSASTSCRSREAGERSRTRCSRSATSGGEGAAALARGAARLPVGGAQAARRARDRVPTPTAASSTSAASHRRHDDLHPLEWAEAFGLMHPDGQPFGPHEAPLLRALRGDEVRDVEMRVETPVGRRAAGQRRAGHRRTGASSAPWSSTPT